MIRLATHSDIPRMISLGRLFYEGTVLPSYTGYEELAVAGQIASLIDIDDAVVYVLEENGQIIGGIGGYLLAMYFDSSTIAAQQAFWFVDPACRSIKSLGLLRMYEKWAREKGAQIMWSGAKMDSNYHGMHKMLTKRGYAPLETIYIKGV